MSVNMRSISPNADSRRDGAAADDVPAAFERDAVACVRPAASRERSEGKPACGVRPGISDDADIDIIAILLLHCASFLS